MCRTFDVAMPNPQLGLNQAQPPSKGHVAPQQTSAPFALPVFYLGNNGLSSTPIQLTTKNEHCNGQKSRQSQIPSVVSSMTPAEFPFPNVSATSSKPQPVDVSAFGESRQFNMPDGNAGKFFMPYDDHMSLLRAPQFTQEKTEPQLMMRYQPATVSGAVSVKHRASCHRCGNLRKKNVLCTRCPHTFCQRCAEKMQEEHGLGVFEAGCPVCKDLCCCGKNRSMHCPRKFHCYKKCPCTKRQRSQGDQFLPSASMISQGGIPFYPNVMNMMAPSMNGMNSTSGYYTPPAMYDTMIPELSSSYPPMNFNSSLEPEWPVQPDPQKFMMSADQFGKRALLSGSEDTTSASELEDFLDDESFRASKRGRFDETSNENTSDDDFTFDEQDEAALASILADDVSFLSAIQQLDNNANNAQNAELLSLTDEQLLDLLAADQFEF